MRFTQLPAEVSVSPYPSSTVNPSRVKNQLIFGDSGAPPETKRRIRPPKRSASAAASLGKTTFSPMRKPTVFTSMPLALPSTQASKPFMASAKSQPFTPGAARPLERTAS
jgi:hypothetical protein